MGVRIELSFKGFFFRFFSRSFFLFWMSKKLKKGEFFCKRRQSMGILGLWKAATESGSLRELFRPNLESKYLQSVGKAEIALKKQQGIFRSFFNRVKSFFERLWVTFYSRNKSFQHETIFNICILAKVN